MDLPSIDGVAFIDPRGSQIDIIQAVGRAIRKSPDKRISTVIIPIFVRSIEDADLALNDSAFKSVWSVLRALRAHDDVLAEQLDELRRELGRLGSIQHDLPGKIRFTLPTKVGVGFFDAFRTRLVEVTTQNWEFWFGLLETYVAREKHAVVPFTHKEPPGDVDGSQLGFWVSGQRTSPQLTALQRQRLGQLPGWSWDPKSDGWDWYYQRLVEFVRTQGMHESRMMKSCRGKASGSGSSTNSKPLDGTPSRPIGSPAWMLLA